nr:hypothetical protein [Thermosporothrix hazakensis]
MSQRSDEAVSGRSTPTFLQPLPFACCVLVLPGLPVLAPLLPHATTSMAINNAPNMACNERCFLNSFIAENFLHAHYEYSSGWVFQKTRSDGSLFVIEQIPDIVYDSPLWIIPE